MERHNVVLPSRIFYRWSRPVYFFSGKNTPTMYKNVLIRKLYVDTYLIYACTHTNHQNFWVYHQLPINWTPSILEYLADYYYFYFNK